MKQNGPMPSKPWDQMSPAERQEHSKRFNQAMRDLASIVLDIPMEEGDGDRYWQLLEAGEIEQTILEVERLATKGRVGGQFWMGLAIAADNAGMTTEAQEYMKRSELRFRNR
jgi:hypothetical protein